MRSSGGVVFGERGEQPGGEGSQVFGQSGIFQQAVQARCVNVKEVLAILFASGFLSEQDGVGEGRSI